MPTREEEPSSNESPVRLYLDIWNVVLILLGVTLVLVFKPFWL